MYSRMNIVYTKNETRICGKIFSEPIHTCAYCQFFIYTNMVKPSSNACYKEVYNKCTLTEKRNEYKFGNKTSHSDTNFR